MRVMKIHWFFFSYYLIIYDLMNDFFAKVDKKQVKIKVQIIVCDKTYEIFLV